MTDLQMQTSQKLKNFFQQAPNKIQTKASSQNQHVKDQFRNRLHPDNQDQDQDQVRQLVGADQNPDDLPPHTQQPMTSSQKLATFFTKAPDQIYRKMQSSNSKLKNSFTPHDQIQENPEKISRQQSEIAKSEYMPEPKEDSLNYSNSQQEQKPSNQVREFASIAGSKILTKNRDSTQRFKQALLRKTKTYDPSPSKKLVSFTSNAASQINLQQSRKLKQFQSAVMSKSQSRKQSQQMIQDSIFQQSQQHDLHEVHNPLRDTSHDKKELSSSYRMVKSSIVLVPSAISQKNSSALNHFAEMLAEKQKQQQEGVLHSVVLKRLTEENIEGKHNQSENGERDEERVSQKEEEGQHKVQFQENEFNQQEEEHTEREFLDDGPEITQIQRRKTPYHDHSMSEASQLINLISQEQPQKKGNNVRRELNKQLEFDRYLGEKERLRDILQQELEDINREIREMRQQKQQSDKITQRKQYGTISRQKQKVNVSDDQEGFGQAHDLIQRMNQQRREKRLRQQREYEKIENYLRNDITSLRLQQEQIQQQMELNRKKKIEERMKNYHKRQMEFLQLQQANQQFVKNLMSEGPRQGQLSKEYDELTQQIKGEPKKKRIFLKQGGVIYLPTISSKKGVAQAKMIQQEVMNARTVQGASKRALQPKLPVINQQGQYSRSENIESRMLQDEIQRDMIERYKESRKQLIKASAKRKRGKEEEYEEEQNEYGE